MRDRQNLAEKLGTTLLRRWIGVRGATLLRSWIGVGQERGVKSKRTSFTPRLTKLRSPGIKVWTMGGRACKHEEFDVVTTPLSP